MKLSNAVKLISSMVVCGALSACATDYMSQLADPNFKPRARVRYSEESVDTTLLMNGTYASKQLSGSSFGAFCLLDRCSQQLPLSSSGWAP